MRQLLVFSLLLFLTSLSAQRAADFGIGLSFGHSNLRKGNSDITSNFSDVDTESGLGFGLEVMASLPIANRFYLTTIPSILFQQQQVVFSYPGDGAIELEDVQVASVVLPLKAELRSQSGKFRPVISGGLGLIVDLSHSDEANLQTEKITSFWEVTAGVEIPIDLVKQNRSITFRPEIFTRRGIGRTVRGVGDNIYNQSLGDATWSYVGLRFLFYGKGRG